ncbi:FAD-dependent oxidoreductase [Lacimicrobium sp. SS2-24]|uniref:NAD(P)/FAD-dependent oxidoreductase n=1 Tax=Lacimicrobium sp. SS2-24 TaxID=2005569 RepID=UPI000B4A8E1E|nr:FAD-dependent oxidoreductase [Lacimicrobium sp. SS2-24]
MAKIAIVGAGISGALLAFKLTQDGHDVTVLEKSRGRGGRCSTKRTEWGQFDMGAPLIHTSDSEVKAVLDTLGDTSVACRWDVRATTYQPPSEHPPGVSVYADDETFYVLMPGMSGACRYWLHDLTLVTSARITHLQPSSKGWLLWDERRCKYGLFDWVVSTAPWPQTHPLLTQHVTDILPEPEAHWLSCRALAMKFAQPLATSSPLITLHHSPLQMLICDSAKPGRQRDDGEIWVAHFRHTPADQHGNESSLPWLDMACSEMSAALQQQVPAPDHHYQHLWRFARLSTDGLRPGVIFKPELKLAAVGDWSLGGSIPSAIKSVQRLYSQLAQVV